MISARRIYDKLDKPDKPQLPFPLPTPSALGISKNLVGSHDHDILDHTCASENNFR